MYDAISKIEIAIEINRLLENSEHEKALRLQRIFLKSISQDRDNRRYSSFIQLDRASKKIIKSFDSLNVDRIKKSDVCGNNNLAQA